MLYAKNEVGFRILATKSQVGYCPGCKSKLIAKCGKINQHHWAHKAGDCDPWYEPETAWHFQWKSKFPKESVEVFLGEHRADVKIGKEIIEFQNSSISPQDIEKREIFYSSIGNLTWVFNGEKYCENFSLRLNPFSDYVTFRWKRPRWSYLYCRSNIYIDFGEEDLLNVKKIYNSLPCGGWGNIVNKKDFIDGFVCQSR